MQALLVFRLCSSRYLVRNSRTLLSLSDRLIGRSFTAFIMRRTFFGHFCAGENAQQIKPVIAKLEKSGLRAILDYAAESDVAQTATTTATSATPAETSPAATSSSSSSIPRREGVVSARTYDYEGEAECDENVKICLSCITSAGAAPDGFAAIKLTALGQPELLEHLSKIIIETNRVFRIFVEHTLKPEEDQTQSAHLAGKIDYDTFAKGLRAINVEMDVEKSHKLFQRMDVDKSGTIDYLEWVSFLDPRLLGGLTPKFRSSGLPTLSQSELERLNAMIARLETLAEAASKYHVKLMVDAEQTYFQPAIDHLVLHLQRRYNIEHPIIYNTYQCYLKSAHTRLVVDMERARREKFWFAAKCVRGAYMIQERKRARDMGYQDPIHDTIQATHANYHLCVDTILKQISRCHVMVATHNEETVKWVTRQMASYGIADRGAGVYFGQLLGMCDHVSFSLGHVGYAVYKYVPYGPIHEVIPYLIRRAEENSDMLGGVGKERRLLWNELKRRMKSGMRLTK